MTECRAVSTSWVRERADRGLGEAWKERQLGGSWRKREESLTGGDRRGEERRRRAIAVLVVGPESSKETQFDVGIGTENADRDHVAKQVSIETDLSFTSLMPMTPWKPQMTPRRSS